MKIENVELKTMAVRTSQYPEDGKPEFLLVGRSNVGKSSFINTLVNRKNFARTSATPGKTQTLNFYLVNDDFYLVDENNNIVYADKVVPVNSELGDFYKINFTDLILVPDYKYW